jgi:hypothetical protein
MPVVSPPPLLQEIAIGLILQAAYELFFATALRRCNQNGRKAMTYCSDCGNQVDEATRFCSRCGGALGGSGDAAMPLAAEGTEKPELKSTLLQQDSRAQSSPPRPEANHAVAPTRIPRKQNFVSGLVVLFVLLVLALAITKASWLALLLTLLSALVCIAGCFIFLFGKGRRKKGLMSAVAGFMLFLFFIMAHEWTLSPEQRAKLGEQRAREQAEEQAKQLAAEQAKLAALQTSKTRYGIGQNVSVGYWTYRCLGVRWQRSIGSEYADARFLVVDLVIGNNDKTASSLPPMKLLDEHDREYDESSKSIFLERSFGTLKSLNPGVYSRGYVVFDVPPGKYVLKVSGGYTSGQSATIELQ